MKNSNYKLGHQVVTFFDVLGQREILKVLRLPKNAEDEGQVKVGNNLGTITAEYPHKP